MPKIKYSKKAAWMKPFVDLVADIIPIEKIVKIRTYRTPLHQVERSHASCNLEDGKRSNFTIMIRCDYQGAKALGKNKFTATEHFAGSTRLVLDNLAHELAHIVHWEHTPMHTIINLKIMERFMLELTRRGMADVEENYTKIPPA